MFARRWKQIVTDAAVLCAVQAFDPLLDVIELLPSMTRCVHWVFSLSFFGC
jgi:hypothetical protein